jgi:hypothetical protein
MRAAGPISVANLLSFVWSVSSRSSVPIAWLGESNDVVAEAATHCLMYLGQANGVTVLFDVDDQVTLRLPTAKLVVLAVPRQSPCPSTARWRAQSILPER